MQLLATSDILMASINFFVALYYLFFYIKRPQIKEHLPFALLCLSVGLYDVFTAGLYNSTSINEGVGWQRLQLDSIVSISIFLIWFTAVFTELKNKRLAQIFIAWFVFAFLVSLFVSKELTLSAAHPAVKHLILFNSLKLTYYEGSVGLVYQIEILSSILAYGYLCYLYIRYYQKTKYKALLLILVCQTSYVIGVLNDALVATQVYTFLYISEYTFFLIVLAMAYTLLDKFVNVHTAYEELNANLEQKVSERISEINNLNDELKRLVDYDSLTGVYNRRFFNEYLEIEVMRARNSIEHRLSPVSSSGGDLNFGLAIIDIDHFKHINDTYGHLVGDDVLKQATDIMKRNIFTRDVLCRFGGDEFALLLTRTSHHGILQAVEKIRREVAEQEFTFDATHQGQHITFSAGLASFDEIVAGESLEILKLADDRLLKAKTRGRNRIIYLDE